MWAKIRNTLADYANSPFEMLKEARMAFSVLFSRDDPHSLLVMNDKPTPLCIAPSIVVTQTGHNILFMLAAMGCNISIVALGFAASLPYSKGTFVAANGDNVEIESFSNEAIMLASLPLVFAASAGITFFCTKINPDEVSAKAKKHLLESRESATSLSKFK